MRRLLVAMGPCQRSSPVWTALVATLVLHTLSSPAGMRQYWAANEAGHSPHALDWQPEPLWDLSDYGEQLSAVVESEAAFWQRVADDGYSVAVELPVTWKFRFDPQLLLRYEAWTALSYDGRGWWPLDIRQPWQTQGFRAAGPGAYRVTFDVPENINPETQDVVLACGGLGDTAGIAYVNGRWLGWLSPMNDISSHIQPGEKGLLAVIFLKLNQARGEFTAGPGGLMGHVKVLTRPREGQK